MVSPAIYWHTLRYLRPVQFYGRLWFRLARPRVDLRPSPPLRQCTGPWVMPAQRGVSLLGPDRFSFLNEIRDLSACGWDDPAIGKLWRYNLHYFDDLNALDADQRIDWHRDLLNRWVRENSPGHGTGWEPYPTSLRIVNWIKWALGGHELPPVCVQSLAVQVRWLSKRLEVHLLGNHLFANAKALVFAGLFFEGDEAGEWLAKGLRILQQEMMEQVLPDGGHFELSPMYHAIILEDLLDIVNLACSRAGAVPDAMLSQCRNSAARMLRWLKGMIHPDGDIAFFNDAALGIASRFVALEAYARRLGVEAVAVESTDIVTHFADSGYVRVEQGNVVALLDVARIGPDYLPGHAHADTLSFELSLFGQRVVVNSGISQYGVGSERLRQRGTAAHSTAEIDGTDSSEVWSGFRVARRARPFGLEISKCDKTLTVACSHDGYQRLPGKPTHRRRWNFAQHSLRVIDSIEGGFGSASVRYYLHPAVVATNDGNEGQLSLCNGRVVRWTAVGGIARVTPSSWHPEFGLSVTNQCIEILFEGHEVGVEFVWE